MKRKVTRMKKLFLSCIALLLSSFVSAGTVSSPTFKMTDGYFYILGGTPIHLIHELKDYYVERGNEFYLTIDFQLFSEKGNPCTSKNEKKCRLVVQFVERDSSDKEVVVSSRYIERYWSKSSGIGWPDVVPRKISSDKATVRVLITKEDTNIEYFRFDIPLAVR
ncbi:MAG: hypothetical protein HZB99_03845 [Candidatus Harrisonbacteria bacterium]|nr:hypothetical protein [Candidatus Harrisonbacteria bacterium]